MVFGGDYLNNNGTGNLSIYGRGFSNDQESLKHTIAGLVTMIPLNGSELGCQFGITTRAAPSLDDGRHTIVGRILEGMLIVRKI